MDIHRVIQIKFTSFPPIFAKKRYKLINFAIRCGKCGKNMLDAECQRMDIPMAWGKDDTRGG